MGAVWDPGSDAPFICGAVTARVSTVASAEAAAAEGQEVGAACGCGLGGTLGLSFPIVKRTLATVPSWAVPRVCSVNEPAV